MWSRVAVLAGLLAGVAVAALVLGGVLLLAPEPVTSPTPVPTIVASPRPSEPSAPDTPPPPTVAPSIVGGEGALFHIGEPALPLVVPQVGGGTIDLAALRGQPVWVTFMGTYCPPCYEEFPMMSRFAAQHEEDELVVLAIDVREDEGTVATFAREIGAIFPMGLDADGSVAREWGAVALPVHFWVDSEGVIRDGALGGIGPDVMARGLRTIMPGAIVEP